MKLKKILALILCAAMLMAFAASCKKTDAVQTTPDGDVARTDGALDLAGAYEAFKPGDVMMTVGGLDVTWDVLYYFLCHAIEEVIETTGSAPDLTIEGDSGAGTLGFKDQIITRALENVVIYKAIEYGAKLHNVTLTEDDLADIALDRQLAEEYYGVEGFADELKANYMSGECYAYLVGTSYLYTNIMAAVYGENGSKVTDAQVEEVLDGEEWFMAKHLLILTEDRTQDEALELAEGLHAQIIAYDGDDLEAFFTDLVAQHGEDPGAVARPEGYIFTVYDMVAEFEQGTRDLDFGEVSEPVQTSYGYHIIYRLPVDYDATPTSWQNGSLRISVAYELLQIDIENWQLEMEIVHSSNYESLDLAKIFS